MDEAFYLSPGSNFEPGDIFQEIPFPALKYPLQFFRPSPNRKNQGGATLFAAAEGQVPQPGDTARGALTKRTVILLSWECEIDAVFRDQEKFGVHLEGRYWLAAPIKPIPALGSQMQERTAQGRQPNKFLLPPDGPYGKSPFGTVAQFIDLRQITPINVPYFIDAQKEGKKVASLSRSAILAMQAHLGMFFSGLIVYVQPVTCPHCAEVLDPTLFVASSVEEEADID